MAKRPVDFSEFTHMGPWAWRSDLLWAKIRKGKTDDDCWTWIGSSSSHANLFGVYKNHCRQMTQAPRIIYREYFKEDCEDLSITHECGNKFCCNPEHFGTIKNNRRFNRDGTPSKLWSLR